MRVIIILSVFLAVICLYRCKPRIHGLNRGYLALQNTNSLKGIFAFIVICHHISQKYLQSHTTLKIENVLCADIFNNIGFLAVAVFFFISGFGLQYSLKNKSNYLNGFIKNKFLKILLPYLVIVVIYSLFYMLTHDWTLKKIADSYTTGLPVARNSWYIIAIIYLYFTYWLSHKLIRKNIPATLMFIATVALYIFICKQIKFGVWWSNSVLCMPLGIIWFDIGDRIFNFLNKHIRVYFLLLAVFCISALYFFNLNLQIVNDNCSLNQWLINSINSVLFAVTLVLLLMKLSLGNKLLNFLSKISFELYMIHGLYIELFLDIDFIFKHRMLYIAIVFLCSILSAYLLNKLFNALFYKN